MCVTVKPRVEKGSLALETTPLRLMQETQSSLLTKLSFEKFMSIMFIQHIAHLDKRFDEIKSDISTLEIKVSDFIKKQEDINPQLSQIKEEVTQQHVDKKFDEIKSDISTLEIKVLDFTKKQEDN